MTTYPFITPARNWLRAKLRSFVLGDAVVDRSAMEWGSQTAYSPEDYGDYIAKSSAVYTCATVRSSLLASLPIKIYQRQSNGKPVEVMQGPAFERFEKVNPFWTRNRLVQSTELSLCLWGKANWFLERGEKMNKPPLEIWWAKASRVLVHPHPTNYLDHFSYEPETAAKTLEFMPQEAVWFRFPNPIDEFDGLSPIAASRLAADTSRMAMQSNYNLFKNGLNMGGLLMAKPGVTITKDQAQEIEIMLEKRFKGVDKAHRWGVLTFEAAVNTMGVTPKDAEFKELISMTLDDIARVFKVPLDLLGGQRTYANVEASRQLIWEECLIPEAEFIAGEINEQMMPMFGDDRQFMAFDMDQVPVLQEAKAVQWTRAKEQIMANALTINDWRKSVGLDPYPWGDKPYDEIKAMFTGFGFGGGAPADAPVVDTPPTDTQPTDQQKAGANPFALRANKPVQIRAANADGAMVGFFLSKSEAADIRAALAPIEFPKGTKASEDFHLTLVYLGDAAEIDQRRREVAAVVEAFAASAPGAMRGHTQGIGYFTAPEGEPYAMYASFDGDGLAEFRTRLATALSEAGFESPSGHDFVPHITLGYLPAGSEAPYIDMPAIECEFPALTLAIGKEHTLFDLIGKRTVRNRRAVAGPAYGSAEHRAILDRFDARVAGKEKKLGAVVAEMMRRQQDAVMAKLSGRAARATPDVVENPFSKPEWIKKFREAIRPVLRDIVGEAGQAGIDDVKASVDFKLTDPNVVRFIETRAQRFAQAVNETTWNKLKDTLSDGYQAGEGVDKLAVRVTDTMTLRIGQSAEVIARTEVIGAENGGMLEGWRQSDIVKGKTWLATMSGGRTRDTHVEAHGQTVGLDEDFEVGDGSGPAPGQIGLAEEDIQCRCTMIAVVS